jgi:hypothetical protein
MLQRWLGFLLLACENIDDLYNTHRQWEVCRRLPADGNLNLLTMLVWEGDKGFQGYISYIDLEAVPPPHEFDCATVCDVSLEIDLVNWLWTKLLVSLFHIAKQTKSTTIKALRVNAGDPWKL